METKKYVVSIVMIRNNGNGQIAVENRVGIISGARSEHEAFGMFFDDIKPSFTDYQLSTKVVLEI